MRFTYQDSAIRTWLTDTSDSAKKQAAEVMSTLPSVIATYRLDGRRYRLVDANLKSMTLSEGLYWLLHGQEIVDTMAAPYAADVVGLLKDNTSYGVAGDHGGAQRPVQEIPIVFAGAGRRPARLPPSAALGRHPADGPARDGDQARAGPRRQGGGAAHAPLKPATAMPMAGA